MRFFKAVYELEDADGKTSPQSFETNRHVNDPTPEALLKEADMHARKLPGVVSPWVVRVIRYVEIK